MHSQRDQVTMQSTKRNARIAGMWYLLMAVTGVFGNMYALLSIIETGDATITAQNIINADWIYRLSVVSYLSSQVLFIFLALALHRLFRPVNSERANLLVILVAVSVAIGIMNALNLVAAQFVANEPGYMSIFSKDELDALVLLFLNLYERGIIIVQIFWGLWLLPFGLLVIQSRFIPKIIGILLVIGCFSYLFATASELLQFQAPEILTYVLMFLLAAGELSIVFWLLAIGARERASGEPVPADC